MPHRLTILRRRVDGSRRTAYDAAWLRLRSAVAEAGANAWRFRSTSDVGDNTEFIEWSGTHDPFDSQTVTAALDALDAMAPAERSDWTEPETDG